MTELSRQEPSRWRGAVPFTLAFFSTVVAVLGLALSQADEPPANPSDTGPWEGVAHDVGLFVLVVFGVISLLMFTAGVLLRSRWDEAGRRLAWSVVPVVAALCVVLFGGRDNWKFAWLFLALAVGLVVASIVSGIRAQVSTGKRTHWE